MSQLIEASTASLGDGMQVRRALPTRHRRLIGAWCFLDHFGPADTSNTRGMRVGPHPHIGLQTVTWLLQGEMLHRDSLGTVQRIEPGALNLMTAGRGISHSEESPEPRSPTLHGVQFWIALPESAAAMPPAFEHHARVPVVKRDGATVSLLAGAWLGERSPATVHTPLMGASLELPAGARLSLPLDAAFEHGVIVTHGQANDLVPGALLYLEPGTPSLALQAGSSGAGVVLVGGEPFREAPLLWWNFVARTKEELTQASRDWNAGAAHFGEVRGYDGERLVAPLPPWAAGPPAAEVVKYP